MDVVLQNVLADATHPPATSGQEFMSIFNGNNEVIITRLLDLYANKLDRLQVAGVEGFNFFTKNGFYQITTNGNAPDTTFGTGAAKTTNWGLLVIETNAGHENDNCFQIAVGYDEVDSETTISGVWWRARCNNLWTTWTQFSMGEDLSGLTNTIDVIFTTIGEIEENINDINTRLGNLDVSTIDLDVQTATNIDEENTSTVVLKNTLTNLSTGAESNENIPLPVADAQQAGVMNSATYIALQNAVSLVNSLAGQKWLVMAQAGTNPTPQFINSIWEAETAQDARDGATVINIDNNNEIWRFGTFESVSQWVKTSSSSNLTAFTNSTLGGIKGSTTKFQVQAEANGTGSVVGLDALESAVNSKATPQDISNAIFTHNTDEEAHADIRALIEEIEVEIPTNLVTTDTSQNITGAKTFISQFYVANQQRTVETTNTNTGTTFYNADYGNVGYVRQDEDNLQIGGNNLQLTGTAFGSATTVNAKNSDTLNSDLKRKLVRTNNSGKIPPELLPEQPSPEFPELEDLISEDEDNTLVLGEDSKLFVPKTESSEVTPIVEYDLSSQLDGVETTFDIDSGITESTLIALYYAGQRFVKGLNYTVDYTAHTITVASTQPLDNLQNRRLILVAGGDDLGGSQGTGLTQNAFSFGLVSNPVNTIFGISNFTGRCIITGKTVWIHVRFTTTGDIGKVIQIVIDPLVPVAKYLDVGSTTPYLGKKFPVSLYIENDDSYTFLLNTSAAITLLASNRCIIMEQRNAPILAGTYMFDGVYDID